MKFDQNESARESEIRGADNRKRSLIRITVREETFLFPLPEDVGERERERNFSLVVTFSEEFPLNPCQGLQNLRTGGTLVKRSSSQDSLSFRQDSSAFLPRRTGTLLCLPARDIAESPHSYGY